MSIFRRLKRDVKALVYLREDAIRREEDFRELVVLFICLVVAQYVLLQIGMSLIAVGKGVLWLVRQLRPS